MSRWLAIETATAVGSVAVGAPDEVTAELVLSGRAHAAQLVPAIRDVLDTGGLTIADLAGIIVGDGPGSFTGLRIGLATAQGMLRAHPALGLWAAPSLVGTALVGARRGFTTVAALYDALRGDVFAAVCRVAGRQVEVLEGPRLVHADQLPAGPRRPDVALGDGAVTFADVVRRWTGRDPLPPGIAGPRASALIELMRGPEVRHIEDPFGFEPDYGRKAEAQVQWERRHGRPVPDSPGPTG